MLREVLRCCGVAVGARFVAGLHHRRRDVQDGHRPCQRAAVGQARLAHRSGCPPSLPRRRRHISAVRAARSARAAAPPPPPLIHDRPSEHAPRDDPPPAWRCTHPASSVSARACLVTGRPGCHGTMLHGLDAHLSDCGARLRCLQCRSPLRKDANVTASASATSHSHSSPALPPLSCRHARATVPPCRRYARLIAPMDRPD